MMNIVITFEVAMMPTDKGHAQCNRVIHFAEEETGAEEDERGIRLQRRVNLYMRRFRSFAV